MEKEIASKIFPGSYILIIDNKEKIQDVLQQIITFHGIKINDYFYLDSIESIKIAEVRKIKQQVALKPQGRYNMIAIADAGLITPEASNAMLKLLEEPPKQTIIILFAANANLLLPTIISRCKKYILRSDNIANLDNKYIDYYESIIKEPYLAGKFKIINEIVKLEINIKDLVKEWVIYLRTREVKENLKNIKIVYTYYKQYKKGLNKKLFLENLFLEI